LEPSETTADRFIEGLKSKFGRLRAAPLSGTPRDGLARGLRVVFHRKYAIYHLVRAREIAVVRALHGARDSAAIAGRGGFSSEPRD